MMRLAAQAYRPRSAITAYGRGLVTTVHGPSKIMTHALQPEGLRDRGQDGCEHTRLISTPLVRGAAGHRRVSTFFL